MDTTKGILICYKACYVPCSRVYTRQGVFTSLDAFHAYARQWHVLTLGKWVYKEIDKMD